MAGTFAALCAFGGLVHVLAPDHWVPASILSWKRGWRFREVALFSIIAYLAHVGLGFGVFSLLIRYLSRLPSAAFLPFSLILIGSVALIRGIRFRKIPDVLRTESRGFWGLLTVLSLLGPCESIIPIMVKAKLIGVGYLLPFTSFFFGSLLGGILLVQSGKAIWNRPLWLPRGIQSLRSLRVSASLMAVLAMSLALLIRIS
jgi:hypothetical protein